MTGPTMPPDLPSAVGELVLTRLQTGALLRFTVTTLSMAPLLRPGDYIVVKQGTPAALGAGVVVLIRARCSRSPTASLHGTKATGQCICLPRATIASRSITR